MRTSILLAGFALAATVTANPAEAFTPRAFGGCNEISFAQPPDVVLHYGEMEGFDFVTALQMLGSMVDIHGQFNQIGGTTASVDQFSVSNDPFVYQTWFGDPQPTIHVGWTSDASQAVAGTFWDVDAACNIVEAHIQVRNPSIFSWSFTEPEFAGEDYWEAGLTGPDGRYFRISYVHELLHAFGLAHSDNGFAMLNYGERPFANRIYGDKIMPLPDDVEGIRYLYPAADNRLELAVLNTWYDPNDVSGGAYPAAYQKFLCKPSTGSDYADRFAEFCGETAGTPGSTEICAGDVLRTQVAVANYSTESVDVDMQLWFSTDEHYDAGDTAAAQTRSFTIAAERSSKQGRVYTTPGGLVNGTEYHLILRAEGTGTATGGQVIDTIPLRGKVEIGASCP